MVMSDVGREAKRMAVHEYVHSVVWRKFMRDGVPTRDRPRAPRLISALVAASRHWHAGMSAGAAGTSARATSYAAQCEVIFAASLSWSLLQKNRSGR